MHHCSHISISVSKVASLQKQGDVWKEVSVFAVAPSQPEIFVRIQ